MTTKLIAASANQSSAGGQNHPNLLELIDAYAEARHVGGCHTYNANAAEARAKVVAILAARAPASRGQALRLLTQKERDSLGRRAEGMDGNEWDQLVQEKFAQVNGLRVQGGSYEWDWE